LQQQTEAWQVSFSLLVAPNLNKDREIIKNLSAKWIVWFSDVINRQNKVAISGFGSKCACKVLLLYIEFL
jgi:hypothetical protein